MYYLRLVDVFGFGDLQRVSEYSGSASARERRLFFSFGKDVTVAIIYCIARLLASVVLSKQQQRGQRQKLRTRH